MIANTAAPIKPSAISPIVVTDRFIRATNVHFLHIAFFIQFPGFKYVLEMLGDNASLLAKKFCKGLLRKPNCFVLNIDSDLYLAIGGGVKEKV
jgi:hypothetical protein